MACVPTIGGVPTGSSSTASGAKWFTARGTSNVVNPANTSSITASICSEVRSAGAGAAALTRVKLDANKNTSAVASAAILFTNRLLFLILFPFDIRKLPSYGEVAELFTVLLRPEILQL